MVKGKYGTACHWKMEFPYLGCFLSQFCKEYGVSCRQVSADGEFSNATYYQILEGKDLHFNCYFRFLSVCREYFKNDAEFYDFLLDFCMRVIVEIWIYWGEEPEFWMKEVWEKMKMEKMKMENK